nr:MAG TPA: hypothetical protein [Caudoviricetes sp.]
MFHPIIHVVSIILLELVQIEMHLYLHTLLG